MESKAATLKQQAVAAVDAQELLEKSYFQADKDAKMKQMGDSAIAAITAFEESKIKESEDGALGRKDKSLIWRLRGKSLVLLGGPDNLKNAEEYLEKVVKLSPSQTKAWNTLAHLEWVRKDLLKAKSYLQESIERNDKDQETLIMLSILFRALQADSDDQRMENVKYALTLAHKAVSLDLGNSEAWSVLGTAHLQNFFVVNPRFEELEKALKAYQQAEKCETWANPDLYFNFATALSFLEAYEKAIAYFTKAHDIDPTLASIDLADSLRSSIVLTANYCAGKAKVRDYEKNGEKPKTFAAAVPHEPTEYAKQDIVPIMKAHHGKGFEPEKVRLVGFKGIPAEGAFHEIFAARILKHLPKEQISPVSFLVADGEGNLGVISLYNTSMKEVEKEMKFGAQVLIARPNKIEVMLTRDDKIYLYNVVRVTNLGLLFVDEKPLNDKMQTMRLETSTFSGKKM